MSDDAVEAGSGEAEEAENPQMSNALAQKWKLFLAHAPISQEDFGTLIGQDPSQYIRTYREHQMIEKIGKVYHPTGRMPPGKITWQAARGRRRQKPRKAPVNLKAKLEELRRLLAVPADRFLIHSARLLIEEIVTIYDDKEKK